MNFFIIGDDIPREEKVSYLKCFSYRLSYYDTFTLTKVDILKKGCYFSFGITDLFKMKT